ncbi:MAG: glycerol-3-phosphate 1-O-acyltransferase PlsY [Clostridiales bacterium]|nr:glycerol-3-phosphate 1-O-acyltransferase PlsY [Clostridiales bacterium]
MFKVFAVILAYFLGNISPAILFSKARGEDIRTKGSGNPGTTNMLRVYGKKAAAATLAIDVLKGVAAVLAGRALGDEKVAYICVVAVVLGHMWPLMWKFKGGKGVATSLGACLAISPLMGIAALMAGCAVILLTRMVSPGSIVGAIVLPILTRVFCPDFFPYAVLLAILVIIKHSSNIKKLLKGEESKIDFSKK